MLYKISRNNRFEHKIELLQVSSISLEDIRWWNNYKEKNYNNKRLAFSLSIRQCTGINGKFEILDTGEIKSKFKVYPWR